MGEKLTLQEDGFSVETLFLETTASGMKVENSSDVIEISLHDMKKLHTWLGQVLQDRGS